jgi:hypothetical protein
MNDLSVSQLTTELNWMRRSTLNFAKNLWHQLRPIHLIPAAATRLLSTARAQHKLPLATFSSLALAACTFLAGSRRAVCDSAGLDKDQLKVILVDLNKGIFFVIEFEYVSVDSMLFPCILRLCLRPLLSRNKVYFL